MKLTKIHMQYFGSYTSLDFIYPASGDILFTGNTGAGKSTFFDLIAWVCYGVTSKQGSVDEVRNWGHLDEPTVGVATLMLNNDKVVITRIRGSSQQNDLFWQVNDAAPQRGKDLRDTQALIINLLGLTKSEYLLSCSYNEFSPLNSFFLAKAKDRRATLEDLADLTLPTTILAAATKRKSKLKSEDQKAQIRHAQAAGKYEHLLALQSSTAHRSQQWEATKAEKLVALKDRVKNAAREHAGKIAEIENKSYLFEAEKARKLEDLLDRLDQASLKIQPDEVLEKQLELAKRHLALLPPICPTCQNPSTTTQEIGEVEKLIYLNRQYKEKFAELSEKIKETQKTRNPHTALLAHIKSEPNHPKAQLEAAQKEVNPFIQQLADINQELVDAHTNVIETAAAVEACQKSLVTLEDLSAVVAALRGRLVENCVKNIVAALNKYLVEHFGGEFAVDFTVDDQDGLDTVIYKNGNLCTYTQLSKGQRQLLRLSLVLAVASLIVETKPSLSLPIFFDEPCDGMDEETRLKALPLFQELGETRPVFVIDHNAAFQSMATNKIHVALVDGESVIIHE